MGGSIYPTLVHPPLEVYYTNRASSDYIICPPEQGVGANIQENTSSVCMVGFPSYLSLNGDHLSYLNESFAFKNFPEECKALS
mmetsp:Transcript_53886/g.58434  ORF Transcript_53886/g.58434 Transcript_53886/m.58434 type:complete len:83 (+) Transcript_53886:692-940(+)